MPDGRAKPLELVQGHRTKAEIAARAEGEKKLRTEEKMRASPEVKANKAAMACFRRLKKIFASVEMDEAFYETGLNRYCIMLADHEAMVKEREVAASSIDKLNESRAEMDAKPFFEMLCKFQDLLNEKDKVIAKMRDQLLLFERENLMTVQGKLRAIPKKAKDSVPTGIEAFRRAKSRMG